ncbi:hypothetical protein DSUL_20413 [Desulfovibrionales bacterium]
MPETRGYLTCRDVTKGPLILIVAALALAVTTFYYLNHIILDMQIQLEARLATMDTKIDSIEHKLRTLDSLPTEVKRIALRTMPQDIREKIVYLAGDQELAAQRTALTQAIETLDRIQQGFAKQATP